MTERVIRIARSSARWLPGVAGAVLVVAGLYVAWPPLGLIAAGAFLLVFDERGSE